jgi:PAS domain-containing protein
VGAIHQTALLGADLLLVGVCSRLRAARQQADRQARQTAEFLDRVTDCFLVLDTDWRFTYVNPPAERIYGVSTACRAGR